MLPLLNRIRTWWSSSDRTQRLVTLGGIGALLLLLVGTVIFATRPRYSILFSGLSELEKGQIVQQLTTMGIPEQHGQPGVVEVPADKTEEAMMGLASAQKLPKESGHWDLEKYKDVTMGTSPEMEGQIIKAVLEGRIARTIEHADGVASATVLLNIPEKRVFAENNDHPTASVTLIEGGSGTLTRAQGRTIANLVCNAVDGMTVADVFVASNTLGVLWDGKDMGGVGGGSKADLDAKASKDWEAKIQTALDATIGAGNTKVLVRADLDMDRRTSDDQIVTPADKPTTITKSTESMSGAKSGTAMGIAGATANMKPKGAAPVEPASGGGQVYARDGQEKKFDTNLSHRMVESAVGDLKGMAITVIANSDKVSDPKAIQSIVNGILGGKIKLDAQGMPLPDQPFTATVTSVKFDGSASAAAKAAADAAAGQQRMQQIVSLLPIGAILFVALLVARQVGKISKSVLPAPVTPEPALAEDYDYDALPDPSSDSYGQTDPYTQDPASLTPNAGTGMNPGMGVGGTDQGTGALPQRSRKKHVLELPPELEEFRSRIDVPLESLKKIAEDRPEMVATLIKSMLLGETL
jgi:flagellar M-ring protein FliF